MADVDREARGCGRPHDAGGGGGDGDAEVGKSSRKPGEAEAGPRTKAWQTVPYQEVVDAATNRETAGSERGRMRRNRPEFEEEGAVRKELEGRASGTGPWRRMKKERVRLTNIVEFRRLGREINNG